MNLTWGEPFWPSQSRREFSYPQLESDTGCDVLVIGAGITGALVSRELARAGLDVIVADKRTPGRGSTAASTSLLLYELDTSLSELVRLIGPARANRAYQMGVEAIDAFEQLVGELPDDCGFARRHSVYLAGRDEELDDLRVECELRRRCGLRVELLSESEIASRFSFRRCGAILSQDAAEVDPYRLAQLTLADARSRKARVFSRTQIVQTRADGNGIRATAAHGPTIAAQRIVYASGYEAAGLCGAPARAQVTYAAVSDPVQSFAGWPDRCLIWETARPYLYLRTTPDGRAMIGGEDDEGITSLNDGERLERKGRILERQFRELFPQIEFRCAAAWGGVFETTPDGLPYIGPHPSLENTYFALGYGGNGMTFAMIAAGLLRDVFLDKPHADAEIFRFGR